MAPASTSFRKTSARVYPESPGVVAYEQKIFKAYFDHDCDRQTSHCYRQLITGLCQSLQPHLKQSYLKERLSLFINDIHLKERVIT